MSKSFDKQYTEVIAVGEGHHIVRTPYDFIHVEGVSAETIMTVLDSYADFQTLSELERIVPEVSRPEVKNLVLRLRKAPISKAEPSTLLYDSSHTAESPRTEGQRSVAILGNGHLGAALKKALQEAGFTDVTYACVSLAKQFVGDDVRAREEDSMVKAFRPPTERGSSVRPSAADRWLTEATEESIAAFIRDYTFVICALEGLPYHAFMGVSAAAEEAGTPTLFVTSGLGNCIVGPLSVPGVTATFADAYQALFRQAAPMCPDRTVVEILRSHPADETQAAAVAGYIVRELSQVFSVRPDSVLFGHLVEVKKDGEASRLAPVLRRTDAKPAAVERTKHEWPELYDGAVLRLAVTDAACTSHRSDRQIPADRSEIRRICIVGGGTAGYLTALTLRRRMPHLEVALLESSKVPVIGVGEATTPSLPALLHGVLGIDIVDFFREVRPTFKLGIRFEWGGRTPEHYFNYPFGAHGQVLEAQTYQGHILDYSLQSMLMTANRVPIFRSGDGTYESRLHFGTISYAYHIDNRRFVECLRAEAQRAGVRHIDATVKNVELHPNGDLVQALVTDDGARHEYDFYVDCSGFRSLLLEQGLGSEWVSYGGTLFTDRAVVANVPHGGHLKPYTVAETMNHGWCWNIPTPESDHRGYVYSSSFCDDDAALEEMRAKNPNMSEPRVIHFRSGRHREMWRGNVVAIGNSFAFVEPLESTGVHMIIEGILAFIGSFPRSVHDEANRRDFNRYMTAYWDDLRWFLGLHFHFNTKLDTPFWQACRSDADVSGLEECISTYREGAPLSYRNHRLSFDRLWGDHGRDVLLMGQGVEAKFMEPRESKEQWTQRVRLASRAVDLAIPQAEGLALLRSNPQVLERLVTDDRTWLHAVADVFRRETAPSFEIRSTRQGRMDKPREMGQAQNVLLPASGVG